MLNKKHLSDMNLVPLISFLKSANTPQLGSFGEAVFQHVARRIYNDVSSTHVELHDFIVDDKKVDVKATARDLRNKKTSGPYWSGGKIPGISYALVSFNPEGAVISLENSIIAQIVYTEIKDIYDSWRRGHIERVASHNSRQAKKLPSIVRTYIENMFEKSNLPIPYMLHRTIMFAGESPHNLLPSQRKEKDRKGWTVFVVFREAPPQIDNIREIIAFPDDADGRLPRLQKFRTGRHIPNLQKADLSKVPGKYCFEDLNSLEKYITQQKVKSS